MLTTVSLTTLYLSVEPVKLFSTNWELQAVVTWYCPFSVVCSYMLVRMIATH